MGSSLRANLGLIHEQLLHYIFEQLGVHISIGLHLDAFNELYVLGDGCVAFIRLCELLQD